MRYDVAVIGGGVIGCAIARELSRYRLRAVVIERECEVGLGTSKANSGIIHAGHHGAAGTLKGELEWRGNQMWDALADDLHFGFKRVGDLTCAFDEDQRATLRQIMEQGRRRGVPGLDPVLPDELAAHPDANRLALNAADTVLHGGAALALVTAAVLAGRRAATPA